MDLKYDNDGEIEVLAEPYPKTNKEMNEWRHRYYDAINDDLGSHDCHGCGYFQAIIWLPKYDDVDNNDDEDDNNESPYFDEDLWCLVYDPIYDNEEKSQDYNKAKDEDKNDRDQGKGVYLCEECAKYVSEKLNEIKKNLKDRGLGEKQFKETWIYWTLAIYCVISGLIVLQQLSTEIMKMLRNI